MIYSVAELAVTPAILVKSVLGIYTIVLAGMAISVVAAVIVLPPHLIKLVAVAHTATIFPVRSVELRADVVVSDTD